MSRARQPVRPLIIVPIDPFGDKIGGIKTFIADFVRFAPDDFEPQVIGCTADPIGRPVGRWQQHHLDGRPLGFLPVLATPDVHRRPLVPLSFQFTVAAMARRQAHRFRGRVLQFHHPGPPIAFLAIDAPKILTVHLNVADIDGDAGESRWRRLPGALHRLEDVTLPRMNRIFVVNRAGLDFYRSRHPHVADRCAFLPTSVDQEHFRPLPAEERSAARAELVGQAGGDPGAPGAVLLFVGRIEEQKNPLLLIEAFAAIRRKVADARLVIVGEGGLRPAAQDLARELGVGDAILWSGYRSRAEMPRLMNGADALMLPSRFEGMPISVLEALACGLPVVATAVGEVPLVVKDMVNGRLVRDHSPGAVAAAAVWVLEAPRERLAAAARVAVAPFTPRETLRPYFDAHRELSGAAAH